MTTQKNFYDFNLSSLQERQERNNLFPELAKFHIALREELTEEEYLEFFQAEKDSIALLTEQNQSFNNTWVHA